jgi:predicted dehydrogenase
MIVSPVLESRLPVGSSAKMMSGSFVRARVVRGAFGHVAGVVQQQCVIRVRKIRFFSSQSYISVDTKEQEVKGYRLANRSIQPIEVTVEKKEPLRAELEAFLRCVGDRSRPLVDGADGVAAVELATRVSAAIDESLRRYHR